MAARAPAAIEADRRTAAIRNAVFMQAIGRLSGPGASSADAAVVLAELAVGLLAVDDPRRLDEILAMIRMWRAPAT